MHVNFPLQRNLLFETPKEETHSGQMLVQAGSEERFFNFTEVCKNVFAKNISMPRNQLKAKLGFLEAFVEKTYCETWKL